MNSRNNNTNNSQNISPSQSDVFYRIRNLNPAQIERNRVDINVNTRRNVIDSTVLSSRHSEYSRNLLREVSPGLNNNLNLQGRNIQSNRFMIISNSTLGNSNDLQRSDVEIQVSNEEIDYIYEDDSEEEEEEEERPPTRRYQDSDELQSTNIDDEYTDYKTYPLLIHWDEIENEESEAYAIYDKHGYFGVSLFSTLSRIPKLKLTLSKFHKNILEYYYKICLNSTREGTNQMIEFINNLPDLKIIKKIIIKLMITPKEIVSVKIILDIYEHYYINSDSLTNKKFFNEYLPIALLFYSIFKDDDILRIYDYMTNINCNKNLSDIISINIEKKRNIILDRLKKLKNDVSLLFAGVDDSKFIM